MKNGIGQVFCSVMRERTNPGQMTFTLMFSFLRSPLKAAPHAFTAAFVCMAIHFQEQDIREEDLCDAFDITARRLNNALKIIFSTLDEGSRE